MTRKHVYLTIAGVATVMALVLCLSDEVVAAIAFAALIGGALAMASEKP